MPEWYMCTHRNPHTQPHVLQIYMENKKVFTSAKNITNYHFMQWWNWWHEHCYKIKNMDWQDKFLEAGKNKAGVGENW